MHASRCCIRVHLYMHTVAHVRVRMNTLVSPRAYSPRIYNMYTRVHTPTTLHACYTYKYTYAIKKELLSAHLHTTRVRTRMYKGLLHAHTTVMYTYIYRISWSVFTVYRRAGLDMGRLAKYGVEVEVALPTQPR